MSTTIYEQDYSEIRDMASKFSKKEVLPLAAQIDTNSEIPKELQAQLNKNGIMGIFVPEEFGGAGMDYMSYAIFVEELAKSCASTAVLVSAHASLCTWPILHFGTIEQKQKYLPKLASGESIGCFCLTEPNAGSDAGSLQTRAIEEEDYFVLNGTKNFITNGKDAKIAIVFAKTEKDDNHKGISAFIVETDSAGFIVQKCEHKLGIKGSSTAQIVFENVKIPKENLLGKRSKGFNIALATLDGGRIGIAAQALGIAQAAFEYATKYSLERKQFKVSISNFQMIQDIIADMSCKIQASRLLIHDASTRKDKGMNYTKEAASAKLFASETAMWVTTKAIQVLGGNGYTCEYPLERHFRDAKITEIYEGTSEIQKLVIASCELKEFDVM